MTDRPSPGDTRERVLDAAEALFAEKGFAGTSVRDIARQSGLRPPSLYNHFTSKQALYEAVLERGIQPLRELMERAAAAEPGPGAGDRILEGIMDHLSRRPHLPRLIHHEAVSGGEHLARLARGWIRPVIAQGLSELKRSPRTPWREEDFPLVIGAWLHLLLGHFALAPLLREIFDEDPLSPEGIARQTRFLRRLDGLILRAPNDPEPD